MSQNTAFSFESTHPDQETRRRRGTLSLAGPNYLRLPTNYHRSENFVAPEYQTYHAGHETSEQPVWGLAKPFPHIVRPGMRTRDTGPPGGQKSLRDAEAQSSVPAASRATRPDHPKPPAAETQAQQLQPPVASQDRSQRTPQPSTHDFAAEAEQSPDLPHLHPSPSEQEQIDAGRQKLQEHAASAPQGTNSLNQPPTANIDWEEFLQKPETALTKQPTADPDSLKFFNTWGKYRHHLREPLAEFLGTLIFMITGLSSSLAAQLSSNPSNSTQYGNFISTSLAWGWGAMIGIHVAGGISGGHLNPAISVTLAIYRGFPWRQCWKYIVAQTLAALFAALTVYGVYSDAIDLAGCDVETSHSGNHTNCNNLFRSSLHVTPNASISATSVFFTQFLTAALFTCAVFAMSDDRNAPPGAGMNAFVIGLLIFVLCAAFPYNTAICLSPARDLGPRLAMLMLYRDGSVFTERSWYWLWGCWIAPGIGSVVGAAVYDVRVFTGWESPVNYPVHVNRWRGPEMLGKWGGGMTPHRRKGHR